VDVVGIRLFKNLNLPRNPLAVKLELALNSINKSGPELMSGCNGMELHKTSMTLFILDVSESKMVILSNEQLKYINHHFINKEIIKIQKEKENHMCSAEIYIKSILPIICLWNF